MASIFVVCILFALAANGAVLNNQGSLLKRTVRSPGCNTCSEHPPPPPPPTFIRGPPSPPELHSASSQASSFREAGFTSKQHIRGGYQDNTLDSGSAVSAQAVAGHKKIAHKGGFSGNQQVGGGFQNGLTAGSSAQAVSINRQDSNNGNQPYSGSGFQNNGVKAESSASAQAVSGVNGFNRHNNNNDFPGNQPNIGSGFQKNGVKAESSASAQAVSGVNGFNRHNNNNDFPGNQPNIGSGFQKNGVKAESSASAHAVSGVASGFEKYKDGGRISRNHQDSRSGSQEKGSNAGAAVSAQAEAIGGYNPAHKDGKKNSGAEFQQNGQAVDGADKQGCSLCAKGGSAVSNAKSHGGTATAIAVNNG